MDEKFIRPLTLPTVFSSNYAYARTLNDPISYLIMVSLSLILENVVIIDETEIEEKMSLFEKIFECFNNYDPKVFRLLHHEELMIVQEMALFEQDQHC